MNENETNNALGSVEPRAATQKRKYVKRDYIYENRFSFTDAAMSRVRWNNLRRNDRRFDEKIPGLCARVNRDNTITFYAYKSIHMYNKNKNIWQPNVVYKKMFQWAKNTGFDCEAARDKVSKFLDKIQDSRTVGDEDITIEYAVKKFIKTGLDGFTLEISQKNIRKL